jgi:hypothetical protein
LDQIYGSLLHHVVHDIEMPNCRASGETRFRQSSIPSLNGCAVNFSNEQMAEIPTYPVENALFAIPGLFLAGVLIPVSVDQSRHAKVDLTF